MPPSADTGMAAASTGSAASLSACFCARFFDGESARAHSVQAHLHEGVLCIEGEAVSRRVPLAEVQWPERTRHGSRTTHLSGGGSLVAQDAAAFDAWFRQAALGESLVVRAQQNWRATGLAVLVLVLLAVAGYLWGVPTLARSALAVTPLSVDQRIGTAVLGSFEGGLLLPSTVPVARQQALRDAFAAAVKRSRPGGAPVYDLRFHTSPAVGKAKDGETSPRRTRIGPNAFALPGGVIVVTDELLTLLAGRDDVLLGVLGHELGHVERRHGMRMLVQATVIGAAASMLWGDFSTLLATAPVVLGQAAYSRDFEREADADSIRLLRANGVSPAVMVELFERLAGYREPKAQGAEPAGGGTTGGGGGDDRTGAGRDSGDVLGISLASHPADAERIRAFRDAAR